MSNEVGHIGVHQYPGKRYENSTANLLAACQHPEVSDEFVFMQDDVFVMRPMERVPVFHRGPVEQAIDEYAKKGSRTYLQGMRDTAAMLRARGIDDLLSYEIHAPMPLNKERMSEAIRDGLRELPPNAARCLHKRTYYGNRYRIGGERSHDFKVFSSEQAWSASWLFLSTTDAIFAAAAVGKHIRARFPSRSAYEKGA